MSRLEVLDEKLRKLIVAAMGDEKKLYKFAYECARTAVEWTQMQKAEAQFMDAAQKIAYAERQIREQRFFDARSGADELMNKLDDEAFQVREAGGADEPGEPNWSRYKGLFEKARAAASVRGALEVDPVEAAAGAAYEAQHALDDDLHKILLLAQKHLS